MKSIFAFSLMIAMMLVFFAACRATPKNEVVIGKGDGQLEEKIAAQTDAPLPSDLPKSGTRIQETYKHDSLNITIKVDATVDSQDGKTMPAAKVTPHKFMQEEVDRMYDHFVGDAHFFRIPDGEEWDFLAEQSIENMQERLEYQKKIGYGEDFIRRLQDNLERARQNYLYAKEETEFEAVTHELCSDNLVFGGDLTEGVYGYFKNGEYAYRLGVSNDENGMSSEMFLRRLGDEDESIYMETLGSGITYLGEGESLQELSYEEAFSLAREVADAFGAEDMIIAHEEAKQYPGSTFDSYYTFVFTHQVNGVPCIYNAVGIANDKGYNDIWDYEQLRIEIDEKGIKSAAWYSPCDITEQLSESTAMIPFEEVMNCFSKMVFIKNSYLENDMNMTVWVNEEGASCYDSSGQDKENALHVGSIIVYVDRITLGSMRVQSGMEFLLIPVWDFYGYRQLLTSEGEDIDRLTYENSNEKLLGPYTVAEQCLLTVNALDGSIIDLGKGY